MLGRWDAAIAHYEDAARIDPRNVGPPANLGIAELWRRDAAHARAVVRAAPPTVDRTRLAVSFAQQNDLAWALDSAEQRLLAAARPADFSGNVGSWGATLAQLYAARGDSTRARAYADSAQGA